MTVGIRRVCQIGVLAAVAGVGFWAGTAHGRKGVLKVRVPSFAPRAAAERAAAERPGARASRAAVPRLSPKRIDPKTPPSARPSAPPPSDKTLTPGEVRTAICAALDDLAADRIGEDEAVRRLRMLKTRDDAPLLAGLRALAAGDAADRLRALSVIEAAYGSDGSPLTVDLDADPDSPEVRIEAHRTHELVEMVGAALDDPDATVRDAAFDAFCSLDGDAAFVLSRQILGGDDGDLKLRMLAATADTVTGYAIGLSIDAMGNADAAVRDAAAANLTAVTGQTFETQEAARDWWEENSTDFLTRAYSTPDVNVVTLEETSESEDLQTQSTEDKEMK